MMNGGKMFVLGAVSILIAFLVGALSSYFPLRAHFRAVLEGYKPKVDTLFIHDTTFVPEPKETAKPKILPDPIKIPVHDTLTIRDTLYAELPREQKEYGDTTYRAWVSGVQPRLDSIRFFSNSMIITNTTPAPKEPRWSFGLQGGVGIVQPFGEPFQPKVGYYVGWGIIWRF